MFVGSEDVVLVLFFFFSYCREYEQYDWKILRCGKKKGIYGDVQSLRDFILQ